MKKVLSFVAALILTLTFTLNCRADLLEYNGSTVAQAMGEGHSLVITAHALMIYDTGTGFFTMVEWATNKAYTVESKTNYQTVQIAGPKGAVYTLIANSITETNGSGKLHINSDMIKGLNRPLKTASNRTNSFPSVMTGKNDRTIEPVLGGDEWLIESADTFTFSAARTIADNNLHLTVDQIVANMTAYLEAHGYRKS